MLLFRRAVAAPLLWIFLAAGSVIGNVLMAGLVDPMVLPTHGWDTSPPQAKLARRFGDDVFRDVGCRSGQFMSLHKYLVTLGMDSTADFLGDMKTFEADEGRTVISYFDFGPFYTGPNQAEEKAVLFLPGLGSLMRSWSPVLLQGLATTHRVVMLDYPGQGLSKILNETTADTEPLPWYSIDYMADSAMKLLESLGLGGGQTSIIGRSMGSLVALQMGVAHGERLNKIVAVSNVVLNTGPLSAKLFSEARSSLDQAKIYYPITSGCDVVQWLCYKQEANALYRNSGRISFASSRRITAMQRIALNHFIDSNQTQGFRRIRNPVMAIHGALDTTAPPDNLAVLGELIDDFHWQLFKKAGHAVTDEYLDYLIMSVQTFLGDSEVTRGPDFAFGKGTLPATNWYWRPYEEGGNCLNPILNCDPSAIPTIHAGSARGVSAPTGPLSNAIPQHIAVSGIDLESLKRAMG
jgi:pimeloyl-ACP methyl ester carboxylesterase